VETVPAIYLIFWGPIGRMASPRPDANGSEYYEPATAELCDSFLSNLGGYVLGRHSGRVLRQRAGGTTSWPRWWGNFVTIHASNSGCMVRSDARAERTS